MARFFQIPNFKRDDYQRPDQKWVCGRACDGKGCQFGPDGKGRCHTTGECRPVRNGDRWTCTRPESKGGLCANGPLPNGECCNQIGPCQPVLSLRARRGRWVAGAGALTLGLLLVLLGGSHRLQWVDPGPLSSAHALSNTRCNDCHTAPNWSDGMLVGALTSARSPSSASCLKCHDLGPRPLSPHGFSNATLDRIHKSARLSAMPASHSVVLAIARISHPSNALKECILCHQEHHGRSSSLTAFTDERCQVCHQASFDSFSKGHPEFANYPFKRRTRLIFDHAKHLQEHFSDKAVAAFAPKDCNACHVASSNGSFMLVRTFEQSCAACHAGQIEGEGRAGDKGIAFFRVPGLDAASLEAKGRPVGDWPADADGPVTPFMRLLLAHDAAASAALRKLSGADLTDLRNADEDRLAAAETLAWAVKSLFADLVTSGQEAIITRLGEIDPAAARIELRGMTAQLPRDGLLSAQAAWFPSLFTEVANRRAGIKPVSKAPAPAPLASAPTPHSAAPSESNLLGDKPASAAAAPGKSTRDDILGDDTAEAKKASAPKAPAAAPKASGDDLSGDDLASAPTTAPAAPVKPVPAPVSPLKVDDAESWTLAGGWYRSSDNPTLYYRPVGHADPFLSLWLTAAGQLIGGQHAAVAQPLFAALGDPKAPGLCMKCHSIDQAPGSEATLVNWNPQVPRAVDHAITKFNHAAHFSLLDQKGCQTCHQMKPQAAYLAAFKGNIDPSHFESNFAVVSKAACAACHNDKIAGESCQLCHTYHTGEFVAKASTTGPMRPID